MANDLTGPVWILDTTGAVVASGISIRLRGVRWVGATTAAHACKIKTAAGKLVWHSVATGSSFIDSDAPSITINGFTLDTLDSGTLYVEVG